MEPARDLRAITELIGEAFSSEMDERGRAALREMRWMARLWPFFWWWAQADPAFNESMNGFVWEEPCRETNRTEIVGNVSLNRAPGNRHRWIICNVVVQEAFRARGIGRSLTQAAIAEARDLGAEGVVLQVYRDNPPALRLYTDLGFQELTGETDLRLAASRSVAVLDAPGYHFRPWKPVDGEAVYKLAQMVLPPSLGWFKPPQENNYRMGWWPRLERWFADLRAARRTYRLVTLKDERLVALLTITANFRQGDHSLWLLIHPDHTGKVEAALLSRAMHMLAAIPPRPIRTTVVQEHHATLKALHDYGFEDQRTLLVLGKNF